MPIPPRCFLSPLATGSFPLVAFLPDGLGLFCRPLLPPNCKTFGLDLYQGPIIYKNLHCQVVNHGLDLNDETYVLHTQNHSHEPDWSRSTVDAELLLVNLVPQKENFNQTQDTLHLHVQTESKNTTLKRERERYRSTGHSDSREPPCVEAERSGGLVGTRLMATTYGGRGKLDAIPLDRRSEKGEKRDKKRSATVEFWG
ncbi:hypothetical protein Cni_G05669 [Canna indica]|uniref:Uncharacterized protein n=1 Tax=Canna indica TaxID=4628 RepID=A0AAQ3JVN3_9LILI|nr:hypothetical protein Cni_G05669 [Canna indica]